MTELLGCIQTPQRTQKNISLIQLHLWDNADKNGLAKWSGQITITSLMRDPFTFVLDKNIRKTYFDFTNRQTWRRHFDKQKKLFGKTFTNQNFSADKWYCSLNDQLIDFDKTLDNCYTLYISHSKQRRWFINKRNNQLASKTVYEPRETAIMLTRVVLKKDQLVTVPVEFRLLCGRFTYVFESINKTEYENKRAPNYYTDWR